MLTFVKSIATLISTSNQRIIESTIEMLESQLWKCDHDLKLNLLDTDLIPHLLTSLHAPSISFTGAKDIHSRLISILDSFLMSVIPTILITVRQTEPDRRLQIYGTVLKQVLVPSEQYCRYLCACRFSIVEGGQADNFVSLLARLIEICPEHHPTRDFVLALPVSFAISSCLMSIECQVAMFKLMSGMVDALIDQIDESPQLRQSKAIILRSLKMEGFDDVVEPHALTVGVEKWRWLVYSYSAKLHIASGANVPNRR
ncbi:hypothetical protein BLNAU_22224 [Blattamonas nauphoetae]|uniref:Uncharacterized protein n=1 Tax=Blattamonas nauphoetae TaxID=2049346 RepID=A0ABQ9WTM5_9EUKA|nr:hypothetical protein BLNAU_22224 [Blattamonas nauphoetae]